MKKILKLSSALLLVLGLNQAKAQDIEFGVYGSFGIPMNWDVENDILFGGGAFGEYFIMENLAVGLDLGFMVAPEIYPSNSPVGQGASEYPDQKYLTQMVTVMPVMATGTWYFSKKDFRPFAGLGLGYTNVSFSGDFNPVIYEAQTGVAPDETTVAIYKDLLNRSQGGFAITPQVGFKYYFSKTVGLYFSARYNILLNSKEETYTYSVVVDPNIPPIEVEYKPSFNSTPYLSAHLGLTFDLFGPKWTRF